MVATVFPTISEIIGCSKIISPHNVRIVRNSLGEDNVALIFIIYYDKFTARFSVLKH